MNCIRPKGTAKMVDDQQLIEQLEQRRVEALLAGDATTLDEITDDDCTHIESTGASRTKADFLRDLKARVFSFDMFEIEANHIRLFGDSAVVTGRYRNIVRKQGVAGAIKYAHHIRVYAKRNGVWKLVAHQATEI